MAAVANAFGNRSVCNSSYEAYLTVKKKELNLVADILASLAAASRGADKKQHALKLATSSANALKQYLFLKLAMSSWKR